MDKQKLKSCLSQFGEFSVAAELNRRGVSASVTYGNQKCTDVVALADDGRYAIIEVKTTKEKGFPTGLDKAKQQVSVPNRFWVFVATSIDSEIHESAYYVLTDKEVKAIQADEDKKYNESYKKKHGVDYTKKGVPTISIKRLSGHPNALNAWNKIADSLDCKKMPGSC